MRSRLLSALAIALLASSAQAGLFGGGGAIVTSGDCGCAAAPSCESPCESSCGRRGLLRGLFSRNCGGCEAAAPTCGCEAAPSCGCDAAPACRGGLLNRLFSRRGCGCDAAPSCGCEAPAPAPSCGCDAAPSCGCDAAPSCGCDAAPTCRGGLLRRLFSRRGCGSSCDSGCDAGCGGGCSDCGGSAPVMMTK